MVTCELNPPKGIDLTELFRKAELLKGVVQAVNLTDSASARMAMAPIAVAHLLQDRGIETILQLTCRDRNRLALQSELLAAHVLGARNFLCMSGDSPDRGDHPDAKPVFDFYAVGLLGAIQAMREGHDIGGNDLGDSLSITAGAVVNPGARDMDSDLRRMEEKVQAGASFFQTQAVYDPSVFERFMNYAQEFEVPVLVGMIVLKSGRMARNINANLPGVSVPEVIIKELGQEKDARKKSQELTSKLVRDMRPMCAGVHIMAIGWESMIPEIVRKAGLTYLTPSRA